MNEPIDPALFRAERKPAARPHAKRLAPLAPSTGPVGVTMVSPAYAHMVDEAVSRFQKHSGLEVIVLCNAAEPSWAAKLNLDLLVAPRPIVFFDIDWWLLRPFDFSQISDFQAVPDPIAFMPESFCYQDSELEGWPKETYFNAGF